MKTGYYWIKLDNQILPARWDGEKWNHENGTSTFAEVVPHNRWQRFRKWLGLKVQLLDYNCPAHCLCTTNPDGSIHVDCGNNQEVEASYNSSYNSIGIHNQCNMEEGRGRFLSGEIFPY